VTESIQDTLKKVNYNIHDFVRTLTLEELNFVLNRYCGPHNLLLREKIFGRCSNKDLQRLINNEIADRMLGDILLDEGQ
jgi:hypothetical protein